MELSDYRQRIDAIDAQLIKLFVERMDTAADIAQYKKERGMKALDPAREREKLNAIASMAPKELSEYAVSLYSLMFELSRSRQNRIIGASSPLTDEIDRAVKNTPSLFPRHATAACLEAEKAYSHAACEKLFARADMQFFPTLEAVFSATEQGLCRYGVIPVEAGTANGMGAVYEMLSKHNFKIVRSVKLNAPDGCTRFICISRLLEIYPDANRTSLMAALPHEQTSLYAALSRLHAQGMRLIRLEGRPLAGQDFGFMLCFDIEATVGSPGFMQLMGELSIGCEGLTYLGSYTETV